MICLEVIRLGSIQKLGEDLHRVQVMPAYAQGLQGLSIGNRVQVLYWMHRLDHGDRRKLQVHPAGDETKERRGVFSLRSCVRPNPIGITDVVIVEVQPDALVVRGLDAYDGAPLIDIKASLC